MAKVASQGGVKNYLGKQPLVKAPKYWQSSPDHPTTELAYITQKEKDLLVKKDLHGSLKGGVNKGPSGIISLNGWGSADASQNRAGSDISAGMDKSGSDAGWADTKTAYMKGPTGKSPAELSLLASKKGSTTVMPGTTGGKTSSNPFKSVFDFGKNYLKSRQRNLYNIFPNNPKRELQFLANLQILNPAKYNALPQNLKNLLENTQFDFSGTFKEQPKFSFEDFQSLVEFDDGAFAKYARDRGSPGLSVSGDMSQVGIKSIRRDQFGNPVKDIFGNTLFDYGPPQNEGGGENQNYLPLNYGIGVGTGDTEDVVDDNEFTYRFGTGQNVGRDVTLGYAANGGRITRAGGGIMNAVPRQGYFLGKIVKGVGKAIGSVADAAGKVLKSDLGKAALAGAAFYYGGGGAGAFKGKSFFGGLGQLGKNFMSTKNPLLFTDGALSLGKLGLASAALPFLMPEAKPNEDIGMGERGGRLKDSQGNEVLPAGIRAEIDKAYESGDPEQIKRIEDFYAFLPPRNIYLPYPNYADGGRIKAQEGGLMDLGGMEKDYRNEGGFVAIGKEEKADDVPARLSVNEFVFTADAVRNAGGGDIDKGAKVMENMMKNLENGGKVSEESQGNTGAQEMFSVSERIGEVI